jgi:ketosteroid isomerase-like protein
MVSWIVGRVVENGYGKQNRGDFEGLTKMFAEDGVFEFEGDTPFGGERRGRGAIREWFEQVARDFGRLTVTVEDLAVGGPPWNMRVIVRFSDRYDLISGETLSNHGFQFARLVWGKVKEDRILVDLGVVQQALDLIEARRKDRSATLAVEPPAVRVQRQDSVDR